MTDALFMHHWAASHFLLLLSSGRLGFAVLPIKSANILSSLAAASLLFLPSEGSWQAWLFWVPCVSLTVCQLVPEVLKA